MVRISASVALLGTLFAFSLAFNVYFMNQVNYYSGQVNYYSNQVTQANTRITQLDKTVHDQGQTITNLQNQIIISSPIQPLRMRGLSEFSDRMLIQSYGPRPVEPYKGRYR